MWKLNTMVSRSRFTLIIHEVQSLFLYYYLLINYCIIFIICIWKILNLLLPTPVYTALGMSYDLEPVLETLLLSPTMATRACGERVERRQIVVSSSSAWHNRLQNAMSMLFHLTFKIFYSPLGLSAQDVLMSVIQGLSTFNISSLTS